MTTFQVIIDSFLRLLSGVVPVSYGWASQLEEHFLHFGSKPEVDYLVTLILSLGFFAYFRFDWLGLMSAVAKTIMKPASIKHENRTLDQEVVLFLTVVSLPLLLLHHWVTPLIEEVEILSSPITYGVFFIIACGLLRFASRWNKRTKGLNHLRTFDAIPVLLISLLSLHPAFPYALVFWLGLSLTNYHYDAVFKYSMLLLGIRSFVHLFHLMGSISMGGALESVGHLNSIAVMVVTFSILWWIILENLQTNLSENTFRSYQWFNVFAALSSFALFFLKG
jgi:hypothetical protein